MWGTVLCQREREGKTDYCLHLDADESPLKLSHWMVEALAPRCSQHDGVESTTCDSCFSGVIIRDDHLGEHSSACPDKQTSVLDRGEPNRDFMQRLGYVCTIRLTV